MDRQRMEDCLERVGAFRASGQRSEAWALAHGIEPRELASWCAHAARWRAKLDGVALPPPSASRSPAAFVAARLPVSPSATVRIELHAGTTRLDLHWPVAHTIELAALLREVSR